MHVWSYGDDPMKRCSRCRLEQPLEHFHKDSTRRDKHSVYCKACTKAKSQLRYREGLDHQTSEQRRHYWYVFKYGITLEEYQVLERQQDGLCAICGQLNYDGRPLVVDHDHSTGAVRGLLCHPCNRGLGQFKDDYSLVAKAAAYLAVTAPVTIP